MAKKHQNDGTLALIQGNKKFAEGIHNEASDYFEQAVGEYTKADPSSNVHVRANLEKAYLNLAASLAGSKPEKAIDAIQEAKVAGFESADFTKNLAVAHYNLGRDQLSKSEFGNARVNFEKAKAASPDDANILYNLGVSMIKNNNHTDAEAEFTALLAKGLSDVEFSLELQLDSYCKLIECQSKTNNELSTADLEKAQAILVKLGAHAIKKAAEVICSHLAVKYLVDDNPVKAKDTIKLAEKVDRDLPEEIASDLEQHALYVYNNTSDTEDKKKAVKMLLTLARVKEVVSDDLLQAIKDDLSSISNTVAKPGIGGSEDFIIKVLGDVDSCLHTDVDSLFA